MIIVKPVPEKAGWFPMPNESAQDSSLSLRARGLLAVILSHRSGATVTAERMSESVKESEKVINKTMRELETAGYVIRHKYQIERGRWVTDLIAGNSPEAVRTEADRWIADRKAHNPSSHRGDGFPTLGGSDRSDSRGVGDTGGSVNVRLNTNKQEHKKQEHKKQNQEEGQPPASKTEDQEPQMHVRTRDPEPPDLAPTAPVVAPETVSPPPAPAWAAPADETEPEDPLPVEDPPTHPGDCPKCGLSGWEHELKCLGSQAAAAKFGGHSS